jgi:hypothetical protein
MKEQVAAGEPVQMLKQRLALVLVDAVAGMR